MARIKVRLKFNPGRVGSPMDKLGEFASQTERFLRALAADMGIDGRKGKWLAHTFTNGSVEFDGEFSESVSDDTARLAIVALTTISTDQPIEAANRGLVSFSTIAEFSKIGKVLDADEIFYIGLYDDDHAEKVTEWKPVSHKTTSEIRQLLEAPYKSVGSVQGIVHSWHAGATPPFFNLRELSKANLIHCEYPDRLYNLVHDATKAPKTVAHVYGEIDWDRVTGQSIRIVANDIEVAEPLSEFDFDRLFGSIPDATGDLSTGDYLAWLRGDEE